MNEVIEELERVSHLTQEEAKRELQKRWEKIRWGLGMQRIGRRKKSSLRKREGEEIIPRQTNWSF